MKTQVNDLPIIFPDRKTILEDLPRDKISNIMIKYNNIPVILAEMSDISEPETLEADGPIKNLLQEVKLYERKISKNIDDFINKVIPKEIAEEFSRVFWVAVKYDKILVETLSQLKALYNTAPPAPIYSEARTYSRVRQIRKWLNQIRINKNFKYLDVGCSEASITEGVARTLGLEMGEIYGCDIFITEEPGGKVIFARSTPTSLPYEDNEFDLVTTFQALHHFTDPKVMLSEIHRVLKPGGIYIIREHDVRDDSFGVFLDVVHAIYSVVISSEQTPEAFVNTYESFYKTKEKWSKNYIEPAGFSFRGLIKTNDRFNSYYARYLRDFT